MAEVKKPGGILGYLYQYPNARKLLTLVAASPEGRTTYASLRYRTREPVRIFEAGFGGLLKRGLIWAEGSREWQGKRTVIITMRGRRELIRWRSHAKQTFPRLAANTMRRQPRIAEQPRDEWWLPRDDWCAFCDSAVPPGKTTHAPPHSDPVDGMTGLPNRRR